MRVVWQFLSAHQILGYYVACVAIDQLPMPDAKSGKFYIWFFSVSHALAANINRAKKGWTNGHTNGNSSTASI